MPVSDWCLLADLGNVLIRTHHSKNVLQLKIKTHLSYWTGTVSHSLFLFAFFWLVPNEYDTGTLAVLG